MPGGGRKGMHSGRLAKKRKNMAQLLAEADLISGYRPPTRVPRGRGKRQRSMRKDMRWLDPSLLVNGGDKKSKKTQTEIKLRAGGYRCNLCGYGKFATQASVVAHQLTQACRPNLRREENQRAKRNYRTMLSWGPSRSASASASGSAMGSASPSPSASSSLSSTSSTDVNTESVESVCATAEALFGPYIQTLESEFKEAYRSRNIKDVKKRKPLPAWMQNRNDFVWHPPNPTMLAHATTQDFQRPAFWICIHTSILRYCDQRFKSSSFLSVERAFYIP